jgi:prolyl-tRNA synthetase
VGEDDIVICETCKYTANTENAIGHVDFNGKKVSLGAIQTVQDLVDVIQECEFEMVKVVGQRQGKDVTFICILPRGRTVNVYKVNLKLFDILSI